MRRPTRVIVCAFSSGLDELPVKLQQNPVEVLRVLEKTGRFSVFEATANQSIARTMTRLSQLEVWNISNPQGVPMQYGRLMNSIKEGPDSRYPWTKVEITEEGCRLLKDHKP